MYEVATAMMSLGAWVQGPSPGTGDRIALIEEFPGVKSLSDPLFPSKEDAPIDHSGVEGQLSQLE